MRLSLCTFLLVAFLVSCGNESVLQENISLEYPSASAMDFQNGKVYLMGDDATQLLVLDSNLHSVDSIKLYEGDSLRLPKAIKHDIESMTIVGGKLVMIGSGSVKPQRCSGRMIDLLTGRVDSIRLDTFYSRLSYRGIDELNIEGLASIPGATILSNRGNQTHRHNQLIFTSPDFWEQQSASFINTVIVGFTADTSAFQGVSGMDYGHRNDQLFLTVSTERTKNAVEDGPIGKSFIWIIKSISSKTRWKAINPDRVIDLTTIDDRFAHQKIESVCVLKETRKFTYLLLCADNDDGRSSLFRVVICN
jgi:hypothetical protein